MVRAGHYGVCPCVGHGIVNFPVATGHYDRAKIRFQCPIYDMQDHRPPMDIRERFPRQAARCESCRNQDYRVPWSHFETQSMPYLGSSFLFIGIGRKKRLAARQDALMRGGSVFSVKWRQRFPASYAIKPGRVAAKDRNLLFLGQP